ncbi:DUF397 domain-containing protein [Amycolatopsis sp. NPDC059027]|uniref:DUF397 domain-containing protein n=1 Tax=Amycolatopsis sp. NPDC059027 TaxID=3346709 RepID=UPI00366B9454
MDLSNVTWRKSSYSAGSGANGDCVEVAFLGWRKSSYSGGDGHNGDCVEVAFVPEAVAVRDSKSPETGALLLAPAAWTSWLREVDNAISAAKITS